MVGNYGSALEEWGVGTRVGTGVWGGEGEGVVCELEIVLFGVCGIVWDEWGGGVDC